jgi:anti-sigma factor RsiW
VVFVSAGWLAHEAIGPFSVSEVVASTPPPAYVEDAVRARGTSVLRASMDSQPEISDYDAEEIRSATAIVMPQLPKDWTVADVQIYPSRFGPSVEMAIRTGDLGLLSLFAVRPGSFDVVQPTLAPSGDVSAAYFQIGEVAYVLVASGNVDALDRAAARLAATLY